MNNIGEISKKLPSKEFKVPFRTRQHPGVVEELQASGITVNIDSDGTYACAIFDNSEEYNAFKDKLK